MHLNIYKALNENSKVQLDLSLFNAKIEFYEDRNNTNYGVHSVYDVLTDFIYYFIDNPLSPLVGNDYVVRYYDERSFMSRDKLIKSVIDRFIQDIVSIHNKLYGTSLKDSFWKRQF